MSRTIILNQTNVSSSNNVLTYTFPAGQVSFKEGDRIALSSMSLYYSWFNIGPSNNTWSYTWTDGTVVSLNLPSGFYEVSTLNAYLQNIMNINRHFLVDATGSPIYYMDLAINTAYYAVQMNSYAVPSALPTNWTLPSGASWSLPGTASTPRLTIGTLSSIIGFTPGQYPATSQTTTFSRTSDVTPQVTPVSSVLMTCDLINNKLANPTQLLYSFSPNVTFGSQIRVEPNTPVYNLIQPGQYTSLTIRLFDQALQPLQVRDAAMVVLLEIVSAV
jgi:hypothetical protein